MGDLETLAPSSIGRLLLSRAPRFRISKVVNVESPKFLKQMSESIATEAAGELEELLPLSRSRFVLSISSPAVCGRELQLLSRLPAWRGKPNNRAGGSAVQHADFNLSEALGEAYVAKVFSPGLKSAALSMWWIGLKQAMRERIAATRLDEPADKTAGRPSARRDSHKIGYHDKWRDYSSIEISPTDFAGDMERTGAFELHRQINKIGLPVDTREWMISAATVDGLLRRANE